MERPLLLADRIIDFECGEMQEEEVINFFQELINTGLAWQLQGHYGRTATALIREGHCTEPSQEEA